MNSYYIYDAEFTKLTLKAVVVRIKEEKYAFSL